MPISTGDRLGPYEIRGQLGAGGMGVVYRAFDTRLHRDVAIKVLPESVTSEVNRARLEREARAVAALSHPNVVSVFDVGTHGDVFYIVSELLEGRTLREVMRHGALAPGAVVDYARQAAAALQAAHAKGIVHRDIKPENLFVTNDGRLKVLDFGLAALATTPEAATAVHEQRLTAPDTVLGTIGYMSPEQLRAEAVDHRSDIFSLGCVIFEMLSGRPPFLRGTQTATIAAILNDPPDYAPLTNAPSSLVSVVQRCLAKNPRDRYPSAAALADDLRAPSEAPTMAFSSTEQRKPRRVPQLAIAALIAAAAVTAALIIPRGTREAVPSQAGTAQAKRAMVAVLPFENLSGDPAQEYFSDGLTEDTTSEFGRLSPERLGVIARTSVMRYKKARADVRTIGRELGVDYVVEGSVRRAGDRVRVSAQLVRTSDGSSLWSESYDRTVDDVFALQSELARDVATAVEIKVAPRAVKTANVPLSAAGRDAFLRGRYHLSLGTPADRDKAVEYMQQALVSDPQSAEVHAGMGRALFSKATIDVPPHEVVPKARESVTRALELDDSLAEGHELLGTMLLEYYWEWNEAERELKRAIALNPNLARAHATYATLLISSGRTEEGMERARHARVLHPLAMTQHRNYLVQLYSGRRWEDAIDQARKVIHQEPQYDVAYAIAGLAHLARNEKEAATVNAKRVFTISKVPVPRAMAAYVYANTGKQDEAREVLRELQVAAEKRFVCFFNVATVHAALGEKEKAFEDLERAIRDRSG